MRYVFAAILLVYGLACLLWPERVFRLLHGNYAKTLREGYVRGSAVALRLVGLVILVAVPAAFLLGWGQ